MELVVICALLWAVTCLGVVCLGRAAARGDAIEIVPPVRHPAPHHRRRRRRSGLRRGAQCAASR